MFENLLLKEELLSQGLMSTAYIEPMCQTISAVRMITLPEETKVI